MFDMAKARLIRIGLVPVDWLLAIIGPRYDLFAWFFRTTPPPVVSWLGRLRAVRAGDLAIRRVPAYREFIRSHHVTRADMTSLRLPPTDKRNYVDAFSIQDRCVGGALSFVDTSIDESSGSTGTPYNRNYPYQAAWTQVTHHPRREPS